MSALQCVTRALALTTLAALLLILTGGMLAADGTTAGTGEDDDQVGASEEPLREHELRWTRLPDKNTERNKEGIGNAVWGGGSFYKAIGALAIEGCDVNAFIAITPDGEKMFHHFQAPNFVNRTFGNGNYMKNIPQGSALGFLCVDACDIAIGPGAAKVHDVHKPCLSFDEYTDERSIKSFFDFKTECAKDFMPEANRNFFRYAPIFQDICIAYFSRQSSSSKLHGVAYYPFWRSYKSFYLEVSPFIIVNNDTTYADGSERSRLTQMNTVLHELCHQQQNWYINKFYNTYDRAALEDETFWNETRAGQEFIEMIGYIQYDNGEYPEYRLEEDNEYYGLSFNIDTKPGEFAAKICSSYMLDKTFEHEYPEVAPEDRWVAHSFLTPQTRAWMEKYMVVVPSPSRAPATDPWAGRGE